MKVDFLIAGVQKAATTAIYTFLSNHPQIFMPSNKELHFFDDERGVEWLNPDYRIYHDQFQNSRSAELLGEATPFYTFWPPCIPRIRDYNQDIRFIVSLRNPVDRAYSHWKMEFLRGQDRMDFPSAIRVDRRRVINYDKSEYREFAIFSYVERGHCHIN